MSRISLLLSGIVFTELIDKLENYWFLFIFVLNLLIVFVNLIYDILKKFKNKEDEPIKNIDYLNKFGEDLKEYYEKKNKV